MYAAECVKCFLQMLEKHISFAVTIDEDCKWSVDENDYPAHQNCGSSVHKLDVSTILLGHDSPIIVNKYEPKSYGAHIILC